MTVVARAASRPMPMADGTIATTGGTRGFAFATRKNRGFEVTGIELINPWDSD
jgi:hypothetical protein